MKLSKAAKVVLEEEYLDADWVKELAEEALEHPSDAGFWDDDLYVTHTLMFHTPSWDLTDEYILGEANYRSARDALVGEFPDDVEDASVGHWTYSRFSCVKVRVLTKKGKIHPAFVRAAAFVKYLQDDYPLLDDSLYSDLEWEVWESTLDMAIDDAKRYGEEDDPIYALTEADESRLREHLSDRYFNPQYISEDDLNEAVEWVLGGDRRQEEELW